MKQVFGGFETRFKVITFGHGLTFFMKTNMTLKRDFCLVKIIIFATKKNYKLLGDKEPHEKYESYWLTMNMFGFNCIIEYRYA